MMVFESAVRFFTIKYKSHLPRLLPLLLVVLSHSGPLDVMAVECIDYTHYIGIASRAEVMGGVHDAAVNDHYVLAATGAGLEVIDVADKENPVVVGQMPMSIAYRVAADGEYAYVASLFDDLRIVDISDPATPALVAEVVLPDNAEDILIQGEVAYIACGYTGLIILDISDPTTPMEIATVYTGGWAKGVAIQDHYAYIATYDNWVVIDLDEIVIKGRTGHKTAGDKEEEAFIRIAVESDYAYALDGAYGLYVYDVSDPLNPIELNHMASDEWNSMQLADDRLYLGSTSQIQIYDLADPALPTLMCTTGTTGNTRDIVVDGDWVYAGSEYPGMIDIVDASNPTSPDPFSTTYINHRIEHMALVYPYAYVSIGYGGLRVVNVLDPFAMHLTGGVDSVARAEFCLVDGDRAYVAGGFSGVYVLDISTPSAPQMISNLSIGGTSYDMDKRGDLLYVANSDGLRIVDVSDDLTPVLIGELDNGPFSNYIRLIGNYVLLSNTRETDIIDISDPEHPIIVDTIDVVARWLHLVDDLLYLGNNRGDLRIYSTGSLPDLPLLNVFLIPGHLHDMIRMGDLAYVASGGVQLLDITDPVFPTLISSLPFGSSSLAFGEDCFYATDVQHVASLPLHCTQTGIDDEPVRVGGPALARLHQNMPNPFNPTTEISYTLSEPAMVCLRIYDISGRAVRTLREGVQESEGLHDIQWNGCDDRGNRMSSGTYLYRLDANGQLFSRRMILLK
jgi:hypothetical protein